MANDFLNDILDKLNGTVAHVLQLRQSLADLEIALIRIRHRCENELLARAAAGASHDGKIGHSPSPSPSLRVSRIPERSGSVVNSGNSHEGFPSQFGTRPVQLQEAPVPARKDAKKPPTPTQIPPQHPPRPPTQLFPFPEHIDLSSYPPELKHEADDWCVLYNPSPKVKRVLSLNMVHTLMHDSVVACVEFSQDGKWLATGCYRTAQIYNTNTGVQTCLLDHGNDICVEHVSFSPDGKYLASVGDDKQIRVWDIANQRIHDILKGHQDFIYSLRFSPNGQFILSGSHDGTVCIWDIHNRTHKVLLIDDHYRSPDDNIVWSMAISPDGRYVAIGSMDTVVSIWEITTGLLVQTSRGHTNGVGSVAFTPDGKGLVTGSLDAMLKYWDVSWLGIESGASTALTSASFSPCLMNLSGHKDYIYSTAVSHDGMWLVSGSSDGNVLFWDMRTGATQCMLSGHELSVGRIDLSPIGNLLATASEDRQVRIWSYASRLD